MITGDVCSSVGSDILKGASPSSIDDDMIYFVFCGPVWRRPCCFMNVFMLEKGASNQQVVLFTKVCQSLSVVVDGPSSMLAHNMFPPGVVTSHLGIQIAKNEQHVMGVDALHGCLELIIKCILDFCICIFSWSVAD